MKKLYLLLAITFSFVSINQAQAVPFAIDFNAFYFSDKLTQSTSSTDTRLASDVSIGLSLVREEWLFIAASIMSANSDDGGAIDWSSTDMGLRLIWFIDRLKQWGLGVAYHLSAKGTYESGPSKEYWRGSSYKIDIGYTPLLFHKIYMGLRVNYYYAEYDESSTDNITFAVERNSKSMLYPSIYLGFRF